MPHSGHAGPARSIEVADDVLVQHLPDGEAVVLHVATEEYYGLDATAARMWTALVETGRTDHAAARLLAEFDIDPTTLVEDLDAFAARLVQNRLVRIDTGTATG